MLAYVEKRKDKTDADDVEQSVSPGNSFAVDAGLQSGNLGGNRSTDIVTKHYGQGRVKADDPAHGQDLDYGDRCATALQEHSQKRPCQDAQDWIIAEVREKVVGPGFGVAGVDGKSFFHEAYSDEEHAKAEDYGAPVFEALPLGDKTQQKSQPHGR